MFRALVALILLLLSFPCLAQEKLCGPATANDGDDLVIDDIDIRLHGIDAFEANQTYIRIDGNMWACGEAAGHALHGRRNRSREAMVAAALAFDCPRFSRERYKADEAAAKAAKRGAWEGTFKPPWAQKGQSYCCSPEFPREFCQ